jgi:hypothetical protein
MGVKSELRVLFYAGPLKIWQSGQGSAYRRLRDLKRLTVFRLADPQHCSTCSWLCKLLVLSSLKTMVFKALECGLRAARSVVNLENIWSGFLI